MKGKNDRGDSIFLCMILYYSNAIKVLFIIFSVETQVVAFWNDA
jgi:hypothetical protein